MMRRGFVATVSRICATFGLVTVTAMSADAQSAPHGVSSTASDVANRVSLSIQYGTFRPAGNSEAFDLFSRELSLGTSALAPSLKGAELRFKVISRLSVLYGAEGGNRTSRSASRAVATSSSTPAVQQTSLRLTSLQYGGVEWQVASFQRGSRARRTDFVRLQVGAGVGSAKYELHQWGDFVDASRLVRYADDFTSAGRGTFSYVAASADFPVHGLVSLRINARRQFGSAPMNSDFASFDRLDVGGTRLSAGITLGRGGR